MSTILLVYLQKKSLDKKLIKTSIYIIEQQSSNNNLDLFINKRISKIIFKKKEQYIIYIQNRRSTDFDILETAIKNILVYKIFNKKNQDEETKKYNYQYIN